jgi:hypothetical protein
MQTPIRYFWSGATFDDFVSVKDILAREIGLPITLEMCYKFLVLLLLEADEKLEALKHYYGITYTNELVVRGIEASSTRCLIARIRPLYHRHNIARSPITARYFSNTL